MRIRFTGTSTTLPEIPAPPVGPTAAQAGSSLILRYSDERRL